MGNKKKYTATILMTLSMVFLVFFQAYWLRQAAYDEHRRLRRELSVLLREVVMKEQMKHFQWGEHNSRGQTDQRKPDTQLVVNGRQNAIKKDSQRLNFWVQSADSNAQRDRPRFMWGDPDNRSNGNPKLGEMSVSFLNPFGSAQLDVIRETYRKQLADLNISLSFTLKEKKVDSGELRGRMEVRMSEGVNDSNKVTNGYTRRNRIRSEDASEAGLAVSERLRPHRIEATFSNPIWMIGKKLQKQILMHLLMTLAISAAFIFLFRNLRQMQRLADLKNNFISNMTHELKTPIATVSVAIEALKNFNASHDVQRTEEYLNISANELQRLNLLVDKVLKLSMFEQDKLELRTKAIDLKNLVAEVLESLKLQLEKNDAGVVFESIGENFLMEGDAMHLQSVVYNLLDNAIKYANGKPDIKVSLVCESQNLVLKITDKGIGIPAEYHQKLFEKFFRVPHGNQHNIKGYGLGLSYVAEVVKRHQGTIEVGSQPGKGSTFTIRFPVGV